MTDELDKWYQSALHVLRHSLGLREDGTGRAYRNHFVPGEGSDDYPICCALVDDGLMTRRKGNELTGGADLFIVTPRGALHAKPEGAPVPGAAEAAYKWGYECLQSRMESIDRHGWAHDCDGEIEARISDGRAPTGAAPAAWKAGDEALILALMADADNYAQTAVECATTDRAGSERRELEANLRDALAEVQRPLDQQMARLNERVIAANRRADAAEALAQAMADDMDRAQP